MLLTYTAFHPCMTCIGNIDQMLVKMMTESKKTPNLSRNFEKKSLFRLLLLANTFYGCLFKTSNQIENGTIDFLFKMHLVWSLEVPKNQKCLEKVTQFSENFVFFSHFILMFLCFIYFLCIGIDLVPQKTLIQKVQFKLWKNNPGPQADTASYWHI